MIRPQAPAAAALSCGGMSDKPLRLGGMALRNGLFVHGPRHWAVAIRSADGTIRVASGAKPPASRVDRIPVVRGVARLAEMLALLPEVKRALPEAQLAFESPRMLVVTLTSAALSAGARRRLTPAAGEALAVSLAIIPAIATLRSGPLARYHGAEHKIVASYETGDDPNDAANEHDRCGSHLVAPLVVTSLVGNLLASRAPAPHRRAARAGASLAAAGIAVEVFSWGLRNPSRRAARMLATPGFALQRVLSTREPTPDELDVARAALNQLLAVEG
jgi:uncharacterized protein YqhQ